MFYMGIIINLKDNRSELQKRIASELEGKAKGDGDKPKTRHVDLEPEGIDGVEDAAYISGYSKSKALNLDKTWLTLIVMGTLVVVVVIVLMIVS